MRAGKWVFSTQDGTGNLIASYEDGGSRVVAKVPDEGTAADDVTEAAEVPVVEKYTPPRCQVQRTANQVIPNNSDQVVQWQQTNYLDGAITVNNLGTATANVTIGETGVYDLCYEWQWAAEDGGVRSIMIMLNGTTATSNGFAHNAVPAVPKANGGTAQMITTQRLLNAGDVLYCNCFQVNTASGGPVSLGAGAPYFGGICGRFTVTLSQSVPVLASGQAPDPTPVQGG